MDLDFLKELGEAFKDADINSPEDMEKALVAKVKDLDLDVDDLDIDWEKGVATVQGMAADQDTREKVLVAIGNTKGVLKVKDEMIVGLTTAEKEAMRAAAAKRAAESASAKEREEMKDAKAELRSRIEKTQKRNAYRKELQERQKAAVEASRTVFYTVEKGDSLSKIAAKHYDDSSKWPQIFEANQPMIKNADLIYPGQVLRIPNAK
jgi:nucleoid-associated protein YgaU